MKTFHSLKTLWLIPFFLLGMVHEASALSGGPDAGGYSFIDSNEAGGPTFNYHNIIGTGTFVSLWDDSSSQVPIGFTFNYYGTNYNNVFIGSNGYLSFGTGSGRFWNAAIPSSGMPASFIAPLWDDLYPPGGQVRYQTVGVAPNRTFIVQYKVRFYFDATPGDFEVLLKEGTNEIIFQYNSNASVYTRGASATAGIQRDFATGLQYSFNQQILNAGLAIRYSGGPINHGQFILMIKSLIYLINREYPDNH